MKIAIINDVHAGKPLMHGEKARSSSREVMDTFESFLHELSERHQPDLFINMGDLIRSEAEEIDLERYHRLMESYKSLQQPVIHLLGNHEIKQVNSETIESVWKQHGFDQGSYGHRTFDHVDIIWLGIGKNEGEDGKLFLPEEQLKWLEQTLEKSTRPLLLFTHCAIDDHNVNGNFFYEYYDGRKKGSLFLENQHHIRELIHARSNVVGVFQAHLHYFHSKVLEGIPYITCPAMNDNICGPEVTNNHPEIYTIVSLGDDQLIAKAYSREYCFAGFEGNV